MTNFGEEIRTRECSVELTAGEEYTPKAKEQHRAILRRCLLSEGCHDIQIVETAGGVTATGLQGEGARFLMEECRRIGEEAVDLSFDLMTLREKQNA